MTVGQLIEALKEEQNKDKLVCVHGDIDGNECIAPFFSLDSTRDDRLYVEIGTLQKPIETEWKNPNLDRLSEYVKVAMNNRLFEVRKTVMDILDILGVEITLRSKDDGCEDK